MNEAQRSERRVDRLVGRQLRDRFKRGGADDILRTYLRLHERTGRIIGEHWLWCALERIAAGELERQVLADYDYTYTGPTSHVQDWQPMDTAPRDGETRVLVYVVNRADGDIGSAMVRTARWSKTKRRWSVAWDGTYTSSTGPQPSGWMPPPVPPNN